MTNLPHIGSNHRECAHVHGLGCGNHISTSSVAVVVPVHTEMAKLPHIGSSHRVCAHVRGHGWQNYISSSSVAVAMSVQASRPS